MIHWFLFNKYIYTLIVYYTCLSCTVQVLFLLKCIIYLFIYLFLQWNKDEVKKQMNKRAEYFYYIHNHDQYKSVYEQNIKKRH